MVNPNDPTLIGQFGHLPGGTASVPFCFIDSDGTQVLLKLSGPGTGELHLTAAGYSLDLTGTALNSSLQITTTKTSITGDDGRFQLASFTVGDGSNPTALGTLKAATTDLDGNLTVTGPMTHLTLGNISDATVAIGAPTTPAQSPLSFNFTAGQVTDSSINSAIGIRTLKAIDWMNTDAANDLISAPFLEKLSITGQKSRSGVPAISGDFQASLDLTGIGAPRRQDTQHCRNRRITFKFLVDVDRRHHRDHRRFGTSLVTDYG